MKTKKDKQSKKLLAKSKEELIKILEEQQNHLNELEIKNEELKNNEEQFQKLIEDSPVGIGIADLTGTLLFYNDAILKPGNYSRKDFKIKNVSELYFNPEQRNEVLALLNKQGFIKDFDVLFKRKDGTTYDASLSLAKTIFNGQPCIQAVVKDISEIKRTEKLLKENEKYLIEIQKIANIGSYKLNIKKGEWISSEILDNIFGIDCNYQKNIEGWKEVIHPDWQNEMLDYLNNYVVGTKNKFDKIYKIVRKNDRTERWVHGYGDLTFDKKGQPEIMLGTIQDITEQKIAEDNLITSKEELQKFFDEDISADYLSTSTGQLLQCNKKFIELFGFQSKDEALAYPLEKLFPLNSNRKEFIDLLSKNKKLELYEKEYIKVDGSLIYSLENTIGYFNENGDLTKIRGFIVDITERKKAIDQIGKLSRAVEQSPTSIVITNQNGDLEYVNEKFCQLSGYSKEEIIGKNPRILKSGKQDKKFYEDLWGTILSGREWRGEFQNKKKNGELYWESASISALLNSNGDITNFIAVKEDITEQKSKQKELIKAKELAEEASKLKSHFLALMSHELRTPLVGILGFSEILIDEIKDPELKEYSDSIYKAGKRLKDTLNAILDLSKLSIDQKEIKLVKVEITEQVEKIINSFEDEAKFKNLDLKYSNQSGKLFCNIDKTIFNLIINNIISNALKYTKEGSINIRTSEKFENNKSWIKIDVEDTGIGIPKDKIGIIFDEFRQVDEGMARNFEGVGLGLTIAKKYLDMLNGNITVDSTYGKGSIFTIKIPSASSDNIESINKEVDMLVNIKNNNEKIEYQDDSKIILIVEDEELNSITLKKFLDKSYTVEIAHTPQKALEMCKQKIYDLILMDINLKSSIDGIELKKLIINNYQSYTNVPFIAQTAYALKNDKDKIMETGFNDYIVKPFSKEELIGIVNKVLRIGNN